VVTEKTKEAPLEDSETKRRRERTIYAGLPGDISHITSRQTNDYLDDIVVTAKARPL